MEMSPEERLIRKQTQVAGQIYHLLAERGWKQRDLARMSGLKESYVSRVLAGDANLTLESIARIESAFGSEIAVAPLYYVPRATCTVNSMTLAGQSAICCPIEHYIYTGY